MHADSPPFDWTDARYFHRYVLTGSVVQTAEFYGISRFKVSRALRRFNAHHPVPLYWQTQSKVQLTEAGQAIWALLDEAFTQAQHTEIQIQRLFDRPIEVIVGLPSIGMTAQLFTELNSFAHAEGIRLVFTGETTPASIAEGLPHLGVFLDRPRSEPSLAGDLLIGGARFDVGHALYQAKEPPAPFILVGGYSEVEWQTIVQHDHFGLDYSRHGSLCQPLSESNREQLARLGAGIVALPTAGKEEDGTLSELTQYGRFPLYSLHLGMHPAYRDSDRHVAVRSHLLTVLSQAEMALAPV